MTSIRKFDRDFLVERMAAVDNQDSKRVAELDASVEPPTNHWTLVNNFKGKTIKVYGGRRVRITGASTPGNAFCTAVDGLGTISEVSTAFLQPENVEPEAA